MHCISVTCFLHFSYAELSPWSSVGSQADMIKRKATGRWAKGSWSLAKIATGFIGGVREGYRHLNMGLPYVTLAPGRE